MPVFEFIVKNNQSDQIFIIWKAWELDFFGYGFGGSIVSDVLMGLPATALGHARIIPCFLLGWVLIWHAPQDMVYQQVTSGGYFCKYFISAWEAVDAVTTPMGRISRSARELQNKTTAPLAAGLLAGIGGGMIRFFLLGRNENSGGKQVLFNALETGFWKTLGYSLLWWYLAVYRCMHDDDDEWSSSSSSSSSDHCDTYTGADQFRVAIVTFHVLWNFACDLGMATGHPFVFAAAHLRHVGFKVATALQWGLPPPLPKIEIAVLEKTEKKD